MSESRETLVRVYRWLRQYGLNDSHSGNASLRDGNTVWITPTGCCADTVAPDELIALQPDEDPPQGASLDAALHLAVYRQVPETGAVIHSHAPHAVAVTLEGDMFAPTDFEGRYYFDRVPVLDISFGRYVDDAPACVAQALVGCPVAVMRGHGVYARGRTLDEAYKWTCSLESSARIAWLRSAVVSEDRRS